MSIIHVLLISALLSLTTLAHETPSARKFFYTGGEYADDGSGTGERILRNQLYVEELTPLNQSLTDLPPIFLIHGQAQTGTNWLNKPDGGRGWASNFLSAGHTVYIVDQTLRGRSAWQPGAGTAAPSTYSAELISRRFTAGPLYNLWPQASLQTQWPGNGSAGDAVFDAFYAANVQFIANATYQQRSVQAAGAALLDRIGRPAVLLGHSQGGLMPVLIADARPELTRALVLLEPTGPPFQDAVFSTGGAARPYGLTDAPLSYDPPLTDGPAGLSRQVYPPPVPNADNSTVPCVLQAQDPAPRRLVNLMDKPVLVVTGEASYHAPYDYCTVEYLRQAGVEKTEFLELGRAGIRGNGHVFFLERNSDEIWDRVEEFIVRGM